MKIGIIGMGVVGGATAEVLSSVHEIYPYDRYKIRFEYKLKPASFENLNSLERVEELAKNVEVAFICVPTPKEPGGGIDYSPMHNSLGVLLGETFRAGRKPEDMLVIIRSTAVSGSTDRFAETYPFKFAFTPEFLRESCALEDMLNPSRIIVGAEDEETKGKLFRIFEPVYRRQLEEKKVPYIARDRKTAEMDKYVPNFLLALQILGANVAFDACNISGINYENVKHDTLFDSRIGRNLDVPGHDGFRGFGGKCLPKDLYAFRHYLVVNKAPAQTIKFVDSMIEYNEYLRGPDGKDWEKSIPGATSENMKLYQK